MPFQADSPKQIQTRKSDVKQESRGANSPNVVTGNNSIVNIRNVPVLSGMLEPANQKQPVLRITVPDGALVVEFGGNLAYSTASSLVAVKFGGENLVSLIRRDGKIAVNARVYSADGRIVADIENNEFTVNPNNYFKIKHPDKSTLIIYNQLGEEAMNVVFVSPAYLILNGVFYKPGRGTIKATKDGIVLNGNITIRDSVAGENQGAAFSF